VLSSSESVGRFLNPKKEKKIKFLKILCLFLPRIKRTKKKVGGENQDEYNIFA
jgi:hypothetical protein